MTRNENLLVTLMEECAEVQQATSITIRFGASNYNPATPEMTNEQEVLTEYYQLVAVMEMIIERGIFTQLSSCDIEKIKLGKKDKVKHYETISGRLGCVT